MPGLNRSKITTGPHVFAKNYSLENVSTLENVNKNKMVYIIQELDANGKIRKVHNINSLGALFKNKTVFVAPWTGLRTSSGNVKRVSNNAYAKRAQKPKKNASPSSPTQANVRKHKEAMNAMRAAMNEKRVAQKARLHAKIDTLLRDASNGHMKRSVVLNTMSDMEANGSQKLKKAYMLLHMWKDMFGSKQTIVVPMDLVPSLVKVLTDARTA